MHEMSAGEGFVLQLRTEPHTRLAVLDVNAGRFDAIFFGSSHLCNGAHIAYERVEGVAGVRLASIELVQAPLMIAAQDILFLHYVLELCLYSLPVGCRSSVACTLLSVLCGDVSAYSSAWQSVFLLCLVMEFGLNDDLPPLNPMLLAHIIDLSIDRALRVAIDLKSQDALDCWLFGCVAGHPLVDLFATLQFLERIRRSR